MNGHQLVLHKFPNISPSNFTLPFADAGLDSMDLLSLRVELENNFSQIISDETWLNFNSLQEICNYFSKDADLNPNQIRDAEKYAMKKNFSINMPQMAIEALSETWLWKELGQLHWDLICKGLNQQSAQLSDEAGNRLYATFARIRYSSEQGLSDFKENELLQLDAKLQRWGNNLYFSNCVGKSSAANFSVDMMTSFSIRNDADNTRLTKSQPAANVNNVEQMQQAPQLSEEFSLLKKNELNDLQLSGHIFQPNSQIIFEKEYTIQPYTDINGVGLLYFAAYPGINDFCEAHFMNTKMPKGVRYETKFSTASRDVFFFANCNINDAIIYRLHHVSEINENLILLQSSLSRKSDNFRMAHIFTIKKWHK